LDPGSWTLDPGPWTLDPGPRTLDTDRKVRFIHGTCIPALHPWPHRGRCGHCGCRKRRGEHLRTRRRHQQLLRAPVARHESAAG